jgi:hypothetical protein
MDGRWVLTTSKARAAASVTIRNILVWGDLRKGTLFRDNVAGFVPHGSFTVRSFVAEKFPDLMEDGELLVEALLARRTFWEKATILHAEFYRPAEKDIPLRYSRHYYDLAMMAASTIRDEALSDIQLLNQVVKHKQTFYPWHTAQSYPYTFFAWAWDGAVGLTGLTKCVASAAIPGCAGVGAGCCGRSAEISSTGKTSKGFSIRATYIVIVERHYALGEAMGRFIFSGRNALFNNYLVARHPSGRVG